MEARRETTQRSDRARSRARGRERFSAGARRLPDTPDFEVADGDRARYGAFGGFEAPDFEESDHEAEYDAPEPRLTGTSAEHAECYACPVGAAYSAVRGRRPEGMDRLANALADLAESVAGAIESLAAEGRRRHEGGRVEHIDID